MGAKVVWEVHARKTRIEERQLDGEERGQGEWREMRRSQDTRRRIYMTRPGKSCDF